MAWTRLCKRCAWGKTKTFTFWVQRFGEIRLISLTMFAKNGKFSWHCLQLLFPFQSVTRLWFDVSSSVAENSIYFNLQWEKWPNIIRPTLNKCVTFIEWHSFEVMRQVKWRTASTIPSRNFTQKLGLHALAWHEYQPHVICVLKNLIWVKRLVNALKYIPLLLDHDLLPDSFWELWNVPCIKLNCRYKVRWNNGKTMSR